MEDEEMIDLLFKRDESALEEIRKKYGELLKSVALRITGSEPDAEECLNDALLNLWRNIPPALPENLRAYSCQTVRNLAFKRLKYALADKRSAKTAAPLDELEAVVSDEVAEQKLKEVDFSIFIDDFLKGLSKESRVVFMKRYFFMDSIEEIASDLNISQSKVKSVLWRARNKLKNTVYKER